jgi:glycosyltransferase involved in cell wall biosynthesis
VLPGRKVVVYEAHQVHHSTWGRTLQGFLARRARTVAVTAHLAERLRALGATRVIVEHDGFRAARFADLPTREQARAALGLPADALIVGYVGRLETMGMGKGLDVVVDAVARLGTEIPLHLLLVGGPEQGVQAVRAQWAALGLPPERLHPVGQIPPDEVPRALAALDSAVLPLPWTEHFAYYASALKLFEYMAAGCAVVASDLPSTAEVIRHGENGLLFAPGDPDALANALRALLDAGVRARLSERARSDVQRYAWDARARRIRSFVEEA